MSILLAILALGILIFVHELGHFIAAKLSGVYVERFSIGFGPQLFKFKKGDTEYCLSAIPLGGYVKLHRMFEDEAEGDPEALPERNGETFYNKPLHKKLFIITAGVLFNFIFAILLLSSVFMVGYKSYSPIVGSVAVGSVASSVGIQAGDKIVAVNGERVRSWEEFELYSSKAANGKEEVLTVTVNRDNKETQVPMNVRYKEVKDMVGRVQLMADHGMSMQIAPIVGSVSVGMPAELAGIKKDDLIISVAGEPISQWQQVSGVVRNHPGEAIDIVVKRGDEQKSFSVVPVARENKETGVKYGLVGIGYSDGDILLKENLFVSLKLGTERAVEIVGLIYRGIGMMVSGSVSKDDIGGPIMIVKEGAASANSGYERYFTYMALISINLAVLNLLPIPVLDGGYVIMYIYEAIVRRRVGTKARGLAQRVGITLLGLLMVFAFYNDIMRFFK